MYSLYTQTSSDEDITNQTFYDVNSNVIATIDPRNITPDYYDDLMRHIRS